MADLPERVKAEIETFFGHGGDRITRRELQSFARLAAQEAAEICGTVHGPFDSRKTAAKNVKGVTDACAEAIREAFRLEEK